MYVCTFTQMYICLDKTFQTRMYTHTHTFIWSSLESSQKQSKLNLSIYICTNICIYKRICVATNTYKHKYVHTYICALSHWVVTTNLCPFGIRTLSDCMTVPNYFCLRVNRSLQTDLPTTQLACLARSVQSCISALASLDLST